MRCNRAAAKPCPERLEGMPKMPYTKTRRTATMRTDFQSRFCFIKLGDYLENTGYFRSLQPATICHLPQDSPRKPLLNAIFRGAGYRGAHATARRHRATR